MKAVEAIAELLETKRREKSLFPWLSALLESKAESLVRGGNSEEEDAGVVKARSLLSSIERAKEEFAAKRELVDALTAKLNEVVNSLCSEVKVETESLSLQHRKTLITAVELLIAWGVQPSLSPGVGIPTNSASLVDNQPQLLALLSGVYLQRHTRVLCRLLVLDIVVKNPLAAELALLARRAASDVLAALFQLFLTPKPSRMELISALVARGRSPTAPSDLLPSRVVEEEEEKIKPTLQQLGDWSWSWLDYLLSSLAPSLLVEALSVVLSAPPPVDELALKLAKSVKNVANFCFGQAVLRRGGLDALVTNLSASSSGLGDDHIIQHVIKMLSNTPKWALAPSFSESDYFQMVAVQLASTLTRVVAPNLAATKESELLASLCIRLAGILSSKCPTVIRAYFIGSCLTVLLPNSPASQATEVQVDLCLALWSRLAAHRPTESALLALLTDLFVPLLELYCFARKTHSHIKTAALTATTLWLKNVEPPQIAQVTQSLLQGSTHSRRVLKLGESGGVVISFVECKESLFVSPSTSGDEFTSIERFEGFIDALLSCPAAASSVFMQCIDHLLATYQTALQNTRAVEHMEMLTEVVLVLVSRAGEAVCSSPTQVFECAQRIYTAAERLVSARQQEAGWGLFALTMPLLTNLLAENVMLPPPLVNQLRDFCGRLESFATSSHDTNLQQACTVVNRLVLERIGVSQPVPHVSSAEAKKDPISLALESLKKPGLDIPWRAAAIAELRHHLMSSDREAVTSRAKEIIESVLLQFHDPESFVYMAAIQCVESLSYLYADMAWPALLSKYQSDSLPLEVRLKVGEVIMRTARDSGPMLVKFANSLVNTCIALASISHPSRSTDFDCTLRVSALSIMAELGALGPALHPFAQDVLDCLVASLQLDTDPQCRRAAVYAMARIFEGLGSNLFRFVVPSNASNESSSVLSLEQLRAVESLLLRLKENVNEDDHVRDHAAAALQIMASCLGESFEPVKPPITFSKLL